MREQKRFHGRCFFVLLTVVMLISTGFTSGVLSDISGERGFSKGVTWQPFVPVKKTTFVKFDKDSLLDDYGFLAAVPASVFSHSGVLYCNPLLFFQSNNSYPNEKKYRFLNDYAGTRYLMEDWMGCCDGQLDKLTAINMDRSDLEGNWNARSTTFIRADNSFDLANKIALDEWSYSNKAVLSVIREKFEKPEGELVKGNVSGQLSGGVEKESFKIDRPFGPAPVYKKFTIEDQYKYVKVRLWYPSLVYHSKILETLLPVFSFGVTIPSVDADLQIYTKYEDEWLQTAASSEMAITDGPVEEVLSYVYNPGEWKIGVTNMPTEGKKDYSDISHETPFGKFTVFGKNGDAVKNAFGKQVTEFNVDVKKYPGVELEIPDIPVFGCRDATFELTWESENVDLGLTLIGPCGEELDSVLEENVDKQKIRIHQLGECLPSEHYKAVVYTLNDISYPVDFQISYSWRQNITQEEGDMIASACEGAILASIINTPLLYVSPDNIKASTVKTLRKLGVEEVEIVDIGGYLSKGTKTEISNLVKIKRHYKDYRSIYDEIMGLTGRNDVIFSTIDPWSYWYYNESSQGLKPAGEFEKAFYFAPAAYAAAIHGSPLLLVDNHPRLSSAVMWHNNLWNKHANGMKKPSTAAMFLTGSRVYEFLKDYGFDKEGAESILTIAGQYDIGPSWSRVFAGVGEPGDMIGTPVDVSNFIARSVFYPALIFENPALKGQVELVNGSKSMRIQPTVIRPLHRFWSRLLPATPGLTNLKIIRGSKSERYTYPVLHTYGCYSHRFNERGSEYWGVPYQTRTGYTPGKDLSTLEIDQGTRKKYEGKSGSFLPDLSETEICPFYAKKAGYSNVFSTNFDVTMNNLNKGVISWYMVLHGWSGLAGSLSWWDPSSIADLLKERGVSPKLAELINKIVGVPLGLNPLTETNPWRGYDMLWGSTEEPDTATLNSKIGLLLGWLGLGNPHGPFDGGIIKIGLDLVPSNIPFMKFNRKDYYDGLVGPFSLTSMIGRFRIGHPAAEIDDRLKNLHSMSFHADSCLIACNYLQIAFMRHGSVLQELDPWPTSYWGGYAFEQTPKDYALGETVGESYAKGRTEIGVKFLFEDGEPRRWWWDTAENVVLFADPDLRIWVPSTEYDFQARNHWEHNDVKTLEYKEDVNFDGHHPFGVKNYPHKMPEENYQYLLVVLTATVVTLIAAVIWMKKRKKQ